MVSPAYREGASAKLDLKKKKDKNRKENNESESIEKDVEAAVLTYVGGTLENNKKAQKRKKSFNNEEVNEFQHWNAFLETDQLQHGEEENSQQDGQSHKKKKKKNQRSDQPNMNVDPELTHIDDTTDHEQLVRAAILDANQLAEDANVNIQDFIEHPQDENAPEIDSSIIQAAQAAAAAAEQEDGRNQRQGQRARQNNNRAPASTTNSEQLLAAEEAAAMVAAAAAKASAWVQNQQQGRMFSKEETEAIDKFIADYMSIHEMTRKEICERVWLNERKKDDFWDLLHKVLPYRTRASVYKHVRRAYHVFEVRGKWTPEQDLTLARLAAEKDGQWKIIGQEMGRMPEDCRDRWRNYVKCGNVRASNKWATEEEDKLKEIVGEIIADQESHGIASPAINWTVVSEKMGGSRSRIQCRYKWNKLLKRDAIARAQTIDLNDRVWLLTKLHEFRYASEEDVQWDEIAALHPKNYWTGNDFKICYEKMRTYIKEFKKKNLTDVCQLLLQDLINDAHRSNTNIDLPVVLQHFNQRKEVDSAANIATAAVNASGTNESYVHGSIY